MTRPDPYPVVIFGAGGLAREVAAVVSCNDSRLWWPEGGDSIPDLQGHLDDNIEMHGQLVNGRLVVGGSDWLESNPDCAVIVAVGNPQSRERIVSRLRELGARFPIVFAPKTSLGDQVVIGEGSIALPGVVVTSNVRIGSFVLLNPTVSISHDCGIGDFTSLGPGVSLAGNSRVGHRCDLGTNSAMIPGKSVGNDCVIGALACVTQDIPDGATAVGIPAKVIKIES